MCTKVAIRFTTYPCHSPHVRRSSVDQRVDQEADEADDEDGCLGEARRPQGERRVARERALVDDRHARATTEADARGVIIAQLANRVSFCAATDGACVPTAISTISTNALVFSQSGA
jgi:hypothetical protein